MMNRNEDLEAAPWKVLLPDAVHLHRGVLQSPEVQLHAGDPLQRFAVQINTVLQEGLLFGQVYHQIPEVYLQGLAVHPLETLMLMTSDRNYCGNINL